MKKVTGKALQLIEMLVHSTDTITDCLSKSGVPPSTYYYRWRKDPVFMQKLAEEQATFEEHLRGKYTSKRRRIEERERLYDSTPDEGFEYWPAGQVKAVKSNASAKSGILNDIEKELEGTRLSIDRPGSDLDADKIVEKRRQQAARLEEWRRDQRDAAKASE